MTKRLFIALEISEEIRCQTASYIEALRRSSPNLRVGWDKPEKLHLTLKFLGDTSDEHIEDLMQAVGQVAAHIAKFKIAIGETGVFPSPRKANVLWIDVKDETGNLKRLNETLETECEKHVFPKEKREFKPHLTIARLREPEKSRELVERHLQEKFEPVEQEVSEIVIFQSILQPTDSVYKKLKSFTLEG